MSLNKYALNTTSINGPSSPPEPSDIVATGQGKILEIKQDVVLFGDGKILEIEQTVEFLLTGKGKILEIKQDVVGFANGKILEIQQDVFDEAIYDYIAQNGAYPHIIINGTAIPPRWVFDAVEWSFAENESAQATIRLKEPEGVQDLLKWQGKPVYIYLIYSNASVITYSGYVNVVSLDFVSKVTTYTCSDLRREAVVAQLGSQIPFIGFYDENVMGQSNDLYDQLEKRLSTTTQTVDLNSAGIALITDMMPKATPDITFTSGGLYRDTYPQPDLKIRSRIVNKVVITLNYQYVRLYQREINFNWDADYGSVCEFLQQGYSICAKDTIESAIEAAGWPLKNIGYEPVLEGGWYNCNGTTYGFVNGNFNAGDVVRQTDDEGNLITDPSGNNIAENLESGGNISSQNYCFGASWSAATRFAQNRAEKYTLTVVAPTSVALYSEISQNENISVVNEFDTTNWENFEAYANPPEDATESGPDYWVNSDQVLQEGEISTRYYLYQSFTLAYARAKAIILKSHRTDYCTFRVPLNPNIQLQHTIRLNAPLSVKGGSINIIGKVIKINHNFKVRIPKAAYTEVTIAGCQGSTTISETAPILPLLTTPDNYESPISAVSFGSIYGVEAPETFYGFSGNKFVKETRGSQVDYRRTNFSEKFRVKTPEIEDQVRNTVTLEGAATYNINIPDYLLTIEY